MSYANGPAQVALSAFFSGRRDDSTFLSDGFFDTSMLLPNQDLAPGYQKVDLSAAYQVHRRLRGYLVIENLFDQEYQPSFGFPDCHSLPARAFASPSAARRERRIGRAPRLRVSPAPNGECSRSRVALCPLRPSPVTPRQVSHSSRRRIRCGACRDGRRLHRFVVRHPGWQRRDLRPRR